MPIELQWVLGHPDEVQSWQRQRGLNDEQRWQQFWTLTNTIRQHREEQLTQCQQNVKELSPTDDQFRSKKRSLQAQMATINGVLKECELDRHKLLCQLASPLDPQRVGKNTTEKNDCQDVPIWSINEPRNDIYHAMLYFIHSGPLARYSLHSIDTSSLPPPNRSTPVSYTHLTLPTKA